jgi:hypothetical protein
MYNDGAYKISSSIVQAIEDAILLGHIREIDGVLELVKEDAKFPEELRYGLEALLYFRLHYGKGSDYAPQNEIDKQNMIRMEASWGRELIESIGHYPDLTEARYA